ncbi:Thiopurine S-methyltransferase (TPMT) [Rhodococcus rhodochrous J3]|uniref:Class I SAM-dependent methyltransferase n=2 Tax=Rhodococcus rhodochrous TaxID=1829 RepID=A0AA46X0L5_RHORH|nr:class I SAM-dependent methyltransferase [Rhodococcus rhodochrous]UZF47455.1 class I SAM-dependent methyltransferase [Rhodococcus rhodochrous]SMG13591.1 Thiopurine S-methyltransferase (TPMT) [Rhodococcus rhodochrous J3]
MTEDGQVAPWDDIYRGVAEGFSGPVPWNIGEPQPEIARLIDEGRFRSDVLDAGCGHAETSLRLAAQGYTVVGLDLSPTAIEAARAAAAERGLTTATFQVADISSFTGFDGRFATIVDSTLFHSLPVDRRRAYLSAVTRAAAPSASFFVLAFAKDAFPEEGQGPNPVTDDELRDAVAEFWTVDDVRPAFIHALLGDEEAAVWQHDDKGRSMLPAWLLSAHRG